MTSSPDSDLCLHSGGSRGAGAGDAIEIFQNSNKIGTMTKGTKTFKLCLDCGQAEFRGAKFFPVKIFHCPKSVSDSVSNADSHDIKILT